MVLHDTFKTARSFLSPYGAQEETLCNCKNLRVLSFCKITKIWWFYRITKEYLSVTKQLTFKMQHLFLLVY